MRYIFLLFSCFAVTVCFADVYMKVDQFGNITYSDAPLHDGKKIEIPSINTSEATVSENTNTPSAVNPTVASHENIIAPYTEFSIISPKNGETIQNQITVPVQVNLKPELKTGDKVQLILDGKVTGEPLASTQLQLGLVERGMHQLYAVIIDSSQKVLQKADAITIYVHRANLNSSPAAKQNANNASP
jgi:hypothetical protein